MDVIAKYIHIVVNYSPKKMDLVVFHVQSYKTLPR